METFQRIIGHHSDEEFHDRLHQHERSGTLLVLKVKQSELGRRRFKVIGSDGIEYGVVLPRDADLRQGAVLECSNERGVVIDTHDVQTLRLRAVTAEGGIQLGWHAGHLHWRVRMDGDVVTVLLDSGAEDYLTRIQTYLDSGLIEVVQ